MLKKFGFKVSAAAVLLSLGFAVSAENIDEAPPHECTSWMLFKDMTGKDTTILHKNRDSLNKKVSVLLKKENGRTWIGMGDKYPCMAMNSSGLAGVMNGGEKCNDKSTNPNGKSTPHQLYEIMISCDTAAQAKDKLISFIKAKDYIPRDQGSIFFFADTKEGYLIEFSASYYHVQKCDTGYVSRANIWHHPGMEKFALTEYRTFLIEATREFVVRQKFNTAFRKNGKVTVDDITVLARETETPKGAPNNRSLCCSWTNSTSTFEIDHEFPDVLSTAYMCVGYPRHTVLLPFPMCLEKVPEQLTTPKWATKSYVRLKALKTRCELPAEWQAFEKESMVEYSKAHAEARAMLKANRRKEAVALLNKTFENIWNKAEKLPGLTD